MRHFTSLCIALLLAAVLAWFAITPPKPAAADAARDTFSSGRAMMDVREISQNPHPTGSVDNAQVRDYLKNRLIGLGLTVSESEGLLSARALTRLNRWSGQSKAEQKFVNIIGTMEGTDRSKPALLLMAHHDTVWGSPGASDDTIGIAAILEILRAVKSGGPPERDIIVLFTDAEELGLNGARQFFASHPLRDKIGAVINFEARGGGGTANMFQASSGNGEAAKLFARSVRHPSASSLSTFVYSVLPNDTDLTPALKRDYAAYNLAIIGAAKYYHSPKITADVLSENSLQHMGAQGLDLTRALVSAERFPETSADAAFFDVYGFFTLVFAPLWGWVFLVLTAIGFGVSAQKENRWKEIMLGSAKMLAFIFGGGAALYGLNILSGAGAQANYYDRLAAIPKLELMTLTLCIAAFLTLFAAKPLTLNGRIGAALPLFAVAAAAQAYAPTAAYFLTLPLMIIAGAMLAEARQSSGTLVAAFTVSPCALILGYMIYLGHVLMLGVGPDAPFVAILPAALGVLALLPLSPELPERKAYGLAGLLAAISLFYALVIKLDPLASTVPFY